MAPGSSSGAFWHSSVERKYQGMGKRSRYTKTGWQRGRMGMRKGLVFVVDMGLGLQKRAGIYNTRPASIHGVWVARVYLTRVVQAEHATLAEAKRWAMETLIEQELVHG